MLQIIYSNLKINIYIYFRYVQNTYPEYLQSGFIQIMQVPKTAYPPLENLKRNYNDAPERVYWRSKQVVDFAFMFYYGKDLAKYYIQIEDDVICSLGIYTKIMSGIDQYKHKKWVTLEFSSLGFIGKLYRSSDLERLANFMLIFYDEQPVDYLFILFSQVLTQKYRRIVRPAVFQHFGLHSSLKEKGSVVKEKERFFADPDQLDLADVDIYY